MPSEVAELTMSEATLYYAPLGTALPADTLAAGGAWPVGWVKVGLTTEPLVVAYEFETKSPKLQQALGSVKSKKTSEEVRFETVMAQLNFTSIGKVWNTKVTVTPAAAGQPAKERLQGGGSRQMTMLMWGFEGEQEDENGIIYPVRGIIYRGQATEGGEVEFSSEDYTGIPLKIKANEDLSKPKGERCFEITRITGPAL